MATRTRIPSVTFINSVDAALLCSVNERVFHDWKKQDNPPPSEPDGTYHLEKIGRWMVDREVRARFPDMDDPAHLNPIQERARKDKELADKTALENRVRRGELVEADAVVAQWTDIVMAVKSKLLRIPFAAAPLLLGVEEQTEAMMILEDQIRDALTELSAE